MNSRLAIKELVAAVLEAEQFQVDLPAECRKVFDDAAADLGNDLQGSSVLDLCADNLPHSLTDLKQAIKASTIRNVASDRIRKAIDAY
jgi:ABC-type nitrate/sulfonate/bicarbonate transport system substrate-binding protein